jgi:hypothetical protein
MDKQKAINCFLERVERLSRLPLITDSEMKGLFGREVAGALMELDRFNQEKQICTHCQDRCCQICGCELYAPQFSQCPIHDFRPVVCRLHFCHKFNVPGSTVVKEIADIFFDSLLAADSYGSARVRLFDSPPLAMTSPDFVAVTSPWVDAVREGSLAPEKAGKLIRREAAKYRITLTSSSSPVLASEQVNQYI